MTGNCVSVKLQEQIELSLESNLVFLAFNHTLSLVNVLE